MSQTTTPSGAELNSCLGYLPISDALLAHRAEAQAAGFSGWAEHLPEEVRAQWHEIGIKGRIVAIACCKNQAALTARNAELEAELATLKEEWFVCCHPAWPDPLPCWGGKADAIDAINRYPHPEAWLLRTLRGGRIEYKGADLEALARTPTKENDDG